MFLLVYFSGYKGYKLLDLDTNTQFISRNVVFHESKFLFHNTPLPSVTHDIFSGCILPTLVSSSSPKISISSTSPSLQVDSTHIRHPPYLQDYHCYSTIVESSSTSHLLSQVLSYHKLSSTHTTFVCALSSHVEPASYAHAIDILEWQIAMADELRALKSNKTWFVVSLLHGKHPVGCKWVYKIKYLADGSINCYKAHLVAKGYTQQGVDYLDNFSPVAKLVTVKVLLSFVAIHS